MVAPSRSSARARSMSASPGLWTSCPQACIVSPVSEWNPSRAGGARHRWLPPRGGRQCRPASRQQGGRLARDRRRHRCGHHPAGPQPRSPLRAHTVPRCARRTGIVRCAHEPCGARSHDLHPCTQWILAGPVGNAPSTTTWLRGGRIHGTRRRLADTLGIDPARQLASHGMATEKNRTAIARRGGMLV